MIDASNQPVNTSSAQAPATANNGHFVWTRCANIVHRMQYNIDREQFDPANCDCGGSGWVEVFVHDNNNNDNNNNNKG